MNGRELPSVKVDTAFRLVKKRDDAAHPYEEVSGGDGQPIVVTSFDERSGCVLGQVVTFEPQQLAAGGKL